jgi:putative ABC transport system permease protein
VTSFGGIEAATAQAVDPAGIASTMDLGTTSGNLAGLSRPGTVAVSEMQASSSGWHLGDKAHLWLGDGTPADLTVVAVYRRGLGFADVTLAKPTVTGHLAQDADDEILVRTTSAPASGAALAAWSAAHPGTTVTGSAALTRQISTDLAIGAWLNKMLIGVMVGYAALAAATTMVMAALARRRELALFQLVGVTRRQIRRMVNAEQAGLLGVAVLIGASIATLTLGFIMKALTGSAIPYIPAAGAVTVLGGATLLALATTIWPVRRLLRTPPTDNIGIRE